MKFEFILAAIKSIADLFSKWFGWLASKDKKKRDAVDKVTRGIGKGKPFIFLFLLFIGGCGYIYTVSTPIAFDANDFVSLEYGQVFEVPKSTKYDQTDETDGYYFSNKALETYVRSKIMKYEVEKRGFFHKSEGSEK